MLFMEGCPDVPVEAGSGIVALGKSGSDRNFHKACVTLKFMVGRSGQSLHGRAWGKEELKKIENL